MIITIAQCGNGGVLSTIPLVDMIVIVINYENDLAEIMVVGLGYISFCFHTRLCRYERKMTIFL